MGPFLTLLLALLNGTFLTGSISSRGPLVLTPLQEVKALRENNEERPRASDPEVLSVHFGL